MTIAASTGLRMVDSRNRSGPSVARRSFFLVLLLLAPLAAPATAEPDPPARLEIHRLDAAEAPPVLEALRALLKPESRWVHTQAGLVVLADADDQALVEQLLGQLRGTQHPPEPFEITIVQGASRAEAQRLLEGGSIVRSSRPGGKGAQTSSLRVLPGQPAYVESGQLVRVVETLFVGRRHLPGAGALAATFREQPLLRGFAVTATRRDQLLELEITAFSQRREDDTSAEVQRSVAATRLVVPIGGWIEVASGSARGPAGTRRYGSHARAENGVVLLRADAVTP